MTEYYDALVDWKEMCRQLTLELGERNKRIAAFERQLKAELAKVSKRLGNVRKSGAET